MITEPCILDDLPNDAYHAETDWVSSSTLKALLPERYKMGGSQEALDFGTLFHTVVLEPDNLVEYTVLDANAIAGLNPKTGKPYDAPHMTAKYKAALAEAKASGRLVTTQEDWGRAHAMRDAVLEHETAADILYARAGKAELSVFAEVDGVKCRARFDRHIPGVVIDLKSTSTKPGRHSIGRTVIDYGYDLSAAHYLAVAEAAGIEVDAFAFVFVSKQDPYYVTVCDLDETFLARGRALRSLALDRHLRRTQDAYEGASGFLTLNCPRWAELESA